MSSSVTPLLWVVCWAVDVQPTLERLARCRVTIVTAATGNMPIPPAVELWETGVRFGLGSDNVHDSWAPFGRGDVLEKAFLLAYRSGMRTDADLVKVLDMLTIANAEILGIEPGAVELGANADLVVVQAENAAEVVAAHPPRLQVIHRGRVLENSVRYCTARESAARNTALWINPKTCQTFLVRKV